MNLKARKVVQQGCAEGKHLVAISNGIRVGVVEPRVAARLLKLIANGNKYAAGVTSLGAQDVRIIILITLPVAAAVLQGPCRLSRAARRRRY